MQDPFPKCRHFVILWHFMAFWHVCQKANCITKSAFSAFFRLSAFFTELDFQTFQLYSKCYRLNICSISNATSQEWFGRSACLRELPIIQFLFTNFCKSKFPNLEYEKRPEINKNIKMIVFCVYEKGYLMYYLVEMSFCSYNL